MRVVEAVKTPLRTNPYAGCPFHPPTRIPLGKKKITHLLLLPPPPQGMTLLGHKNTTVFDWRKEQPKPCQDDEFLFARIIWFCCISWIFVGEKSHWRMDSNKKHICFEGGPGRSSLESLPLERTIWDPLTAWRFPSSLPRLKVGWPFWGEVQTPFFFFGKVFKGSDFLVGKLKWRIHRILNQKQDLDLFLWFHKLLILCCWEKKVWIMVQWV